ncbi:MAG TPA: peptidylprolyl isomerase [Aggregatilineales bacterium]|nr:peptidylprolyl isomerase [Anaerolineales bacterium]HRE47060.1 peptidylprolyl isomerase [Aggregatilineales bacterium]
MTDMIGDNKVVEIAYTLTLDDGRVMDEAEGDDPLAYLHGAGNIIPGLEKALVGLKVGDTKDIVIAAKDGYGEYDEEAIEVVPIKDLPKGAPLELGMEVGFQDDDGNMDTAVVKAIGPNEITFDFNHPLAGQTLHFTVEIIGVREATEEELEHGHPHGLDFDDEFDDFDDEDFDDDEDYDDEDEDDDDDDLPLYRKQ